MASFSVRLTASATQGFTEPLDGLGSAIPLEMILIKGGSFSMGSPANELQRYEAAGPQHRVTVPTFFMGRYPITHAQWRTVAAMPPVNRELNAQIPALSEYERPTYAAQKAYTEKCFNIGGNHPAAPICRSDAVEFCDRLAQHSGRPYRLPSEAEWEYACRAGTETPFAFGTTLAPGLANYDDAKYQEKQWTLHNKKTTPVNYFGVANAWGLCDMHGNVREWCADQWHENYQGAPTDGRIWLLSDEEIKRLPCEAQVKCVYRGGYYGGSATDCRSTYRNWTYQTSVTGFRLACSAFQ